MDQRQRIAMQRAKGQEALGLLRAAAELFGVEDNASGDDLRDLDVWNAKIAELEDWLYGESPIA